MELQGKKVTHDFLSLYPPDSSFQLQDPRSSSQGFYLKTRDFLQPLERGSGASADGGRSPTEQVFAGPCSVVSHVGDAVAVAKPGTSSAAVRAGFPVGLEAKPEPDYGSRSTTTSYGSHAGGGVSYTLWDDKDTACRGQWSSSLSAARGGSGSGGGCSGAVSAFAGRNNSAAPEKKPLVEAVTSRSNNFDDEEEVFVKREGSSSRQDLTIKVDGQANSDQRPNTPRSKHSATEQRRRSKINDRFQILREIIPHSDQRRDKASFLLEVIEYIRFLQEKVQKYESSCSMWNQDNSAKLMPWKNSQAPADGLAIPSQVIKSDPSPPQMFSKKSDGSGIPVVTAGNSYKTMETPISFSSNLAVAAADLHNLIQPRLITIGKEIASIDHPQQRSIQILNQDNMAFQDQSPWSRSSGLAGDEQEELTIDDGTISVSTAYSNGLLNALAQTLQRSGVDLSQASIAVQINLGRKAINRRPATTASTSAMKDPRNPSSIYQAAFRYSRTGNGNEQSQAPPKRRRVGQ